MTEFRDSNEKRIAWAKGGEGKARRVVFQDGRDRGRWHLLVSTKTRVASIRLDAQTKGAATREAKTYA